MSEVKIESGVPMPQAGGREIIWPFREMKVGDSFFAEGKPTSSFGGSISFCRKTSGYEKWKFACRTVVENGVKGCRVWRIK